ncbi:MAG: response regulator [Desulfobacterales bacterium]|nr:MAG: response regulator [Desulfobacterales bacterium]
MLKYLTDLLEREGHEVATAQDGFAALNKLTSFFPDIMFFDLIMPKIDGDKLCQIVRNMPHLKDCYLVILSAAVAELDFDHTEIGANAYIAKGPFETTARHVLAAIEASDTLPQDDESKAIKGLDSVYARRLTKELLSRNRHLETILESMSEGILEVYCGKIVYANAAAISIFGLPQERLLAALPQDLFEGQIRSQIDALIDNKDEKPMEIGEISPIELNGRLVTVKNVPVGNDPSTIIILITDITDRKKLEMRLQHVQKMEAIGTIAAGVAHNFRNTLTEILVNSQVIQMNYEDKSGLHEVAGRINKSVKRGAGLVDGLLQFSRRQIETEFQNLDLADVIQDTYQLIRKSFDQKIDIQIDVPSSLPVLGDAAGLSQTLMNLCTNARDAMPEGGELRIEARIVRDQAELIVADSGQGMDRETIEKCFDPFFTTKPVGQGTGLGLSTTYGIVKSHKGKVSVDSALNRGTTITISLPLADTVEKIQETATPQISPGTGQRILVVDDEEQILNAMKDLLNGLNYRPILAKTGKEGLNKYETFNPEVVLLDINMPEMGGFICAEKLLDIDPAAKIAFISGYEMNGLDGLKDRVKDSIRGYLTKPAALPELSSLLYQVLNSH